MSAALLFATTAAGAAADPAHPLIPVPSGAEVWLQESMTDRVPGMGLVQRYRFVMPKLADAVPPMPEADMTANLPPEDMLDGPIDGPDVPLTAAEQAEIDAALGDLEIRPASDDPSVDWQPGSPAGGDPAGVQDFGTSGADAGPGAIDGPLPSELAAPDAALPDGTQPDFTAPDAPMHDSEAMGDLAAIAAGPDRAPDDVEGDMPLPAAPDILMQDPAHRDIVFLCENFALPQITLMQPRPTQVVISMASAPSTFGSFDPNIVQLFEGFSIPMDRDACVWEPM